MVMAVDLSTKKVGIAIFDNSKLVSYQLVEADKKKKVLQRIHYITNELTKLFQENNCDTLVLEGVPLNMNSKVMFKLLWCQGSVLANIVGSGLCDTFELYQPSSWRSMLGIKNGRGIKRAELKQLSKDYVKKTLGKDIESDDVCDAICIGLAYIK